MAVALTPEPPIPPPVTLATDDPLAEALALAVDVANVEADADEV